MLLGCACIFSRSTSIMDKKRLAPGKRTASREAILNKGPGGELTKSRILNSNPVAKSTYLIPTIRKRALRGSFFWRYFGRHYGKFNYAHIPHSGQGCFRQSRGGRKKMGMEKNSKWLVTSVLLLLFSLFFIKDACAQFR